MLHMLHAAQRRGGCETLYHAQTAVALAHTQSYGTGSNQAVTLEHTSGELIAKHGNNVNDMALECKTTNFTCTSLSAAVPVLMGTGQAEG